MASGFGSPNYLRPPVVETVLGLYFEPFKDLTNSHLGAYWSAIAKEWPNVADTMPLESYWEEFDDSRWGQTHFKVQVSNAVELRILIKNSDDDRMIQLQNGQFHFNWLGVAGQQYPRYAAVRQEFLNVFASFRNFAETTARLGSVRPTQWEVTYLNSIPVGELWTTPADWGFFTLFGRTDNIDSFARFESFSGEWHFEIPEKKGRLHIQWRHVTQDDEESIVLTLTARGPIGNGINLESGIDLGHSVIVNSFRSLMSAQANAYWGLQDGDC